MPGKLKCGIAASVVMEAYCRLNWQAGMRQRDLPRLKRSNFDAEGRITFVQSKTRRRHVVLVDPTTMEAVNACFRPDCDRVFPIGRWGLTEHKRKAWKAAGLDRPAAFSRLRKNFATAIAARDGLEAAARALGHISGTTVARTWYVDPVALDQPAQPPDLT
jgi:integrase